MSFICLWSTRHWRAQDAYILLLVSTQSTCPKFSTFSLKGGSTVLLILQTTRAKTYCKCPYKYQYFHTSALGHCLGKSMTSELVYNFPLMSMYFISVLLWVPKNNDNCKVTFTKISVHKRCTVLSAILRGTATEVRGPSCAQATD